MGSMPHEYPRRFVVKEDVNRPFRDSQAQERQGFASENFYDAALTGTVEAAIQEEVEMRLAALQRQRPWTLAQIVSEVQRCLSCSRRYAA
mmetsp:Transcript_6859/g.12134  ORF Transcript_6859/g.12134 Transcript_6859/m.12134 type:complete len:90 (+) Transcript_6859:54-323(+)